MYGYIYKTTYLKNNAIYIGQHTNHYVRKYQKIDPRYFGSGKIIQNIIKKNGTQDLRCEILEWCDSPELLNEREIFYIKEYKKDMGDSCYNIAEGGEGGFNEFYMTPAQRKKIKEKELQTKANKSEEEKIKLANRIRNTLLNKSPEARAEIEAKRQRSLARRTEADKQRSTDQRMQTVSQWSEDYRREYLKNLSEKHSKPVILTNGVEVFEFESAQSCSRALGWSDCMIGMYIRQYNGVIKKRNSKYYGWKIFYKEQQ